MGTNLFSYPLPNLINGVSQQAPSQRRDTQCEEQINCINSPVDGAIARPPSVVKTFLPGVDLTNGYYFDIIRSDTEKHRAVIQPGSIRVWNLLTGAECTVNKPNGVGYLATSYPARKSFRVTPVEDYVFIANKAIIPAMNTSDVQPARPYEGILYFRGANFLETYTIKITIGGSTYTWTMQTVSNAATANSAYVQTDFLATQLVSLLTGAAPTNLNAYSVPSGGVTVTSLGFTIQREAFCVYLSHATSDWSLKVSDGSAGDILRGIKGQTQAYDNLPATCVDGFVAKVRGDNDKTEDDYWVQFSSTTNNETGNANANGVWTEVPKPGTVLSINAATMPFALISEGSDVFTFKQMVWGKRVSGDGVNTAKNPEFIGDPIEDIFLHRNRLGILTTNTATWSKAKQFFTFFPDSAQTALDTDPISYVVSHTKVALLNTALVFNGQLMLWADGTQFVVQSGDTLKESTVDIMPVTEFSFNPDVRPVGIGSNVYFTSASGDWAALWEFYVTDQGTSRDANDITSQVPSYIPSDLFCLAGSSSERILVGVASSTPHQMWVHNFYISGQDKLQSAWNRWDLPEQGDILWATFDDNVLRILVQRPDGASFEELNVQPIQTDSGLPYLIRLDRRIKETQVSSITYNSSTDSSALVLPFRYHERDPLLVTRASSSRVPAGSQFSLTHVSGNTYTTDGDVTGLSFFIGLPFKSSIKMSPFYPKDQQNVFIPVDRLQISKINLVHSGTGYYRGEVTHLSGKTYSYAFEGRVLGSPLNNTDSISIEDGSFGFPVRANARKVTVEIINDTWLPSAWQSGEIQYGFSSRAVRRQ